MQCPACGRANIDTAEYCVFCGSRIRISAEEPIRGEQPAALEFQAPVSAGPPPPGPVPQGPAGFMPPPLAAPGYFAPGAGMAPPYMCLVCGYLMSPLETSCPRCRTPRGMSVDPEAAAPGTVRPVATQPDDGNTSGTGAPAPPAVAAGFNWGAFWLPVPWALAHRVYPPLIIFVLWVVEQAVALPKVIGGWAASPETGPPAELSMVSVALAAAGWALCMYFGTKGNAWAWQRRHFYTVEHFRAVQSTWAGWAKMAMVLTALLWAMQILMVATHTSIWSI